MERRFVRAGAIRARLVGKSPRPHVALSGNHFFVALGAAAVARETTPNARVVSGDKAPIGCDGERD